MESIGEQGWYGHGWPIFNSIPFLQNGFGIFGNTFLDVIDVFVCFWLVFNGFNMFWIVLGIFGDPVRDQEI